MAIHLRSSKDLHLLRMDHPSWKDGPSILTWCSIALILMKMRSLCLSQPTISHLILIHPTISTFSSSFHPSIRKVSILGWMDHSIGWAIHPEKLHRHHPYWSDSPQDGDRTFLRRLRFNTVPASCRADCLLR